MALTPYQQALIMMEAGPMMASGGDSVKAMLDILKAGPNAQQPTAQPGPFQQSVTNATTPAAPAATTSAATSTAIAGGGGLTGTLPNYEMESQSAQPAGNTKVVSTPSAAQSAGNQYAQYGQYASGLQSLISSLNANWGK